MLQPRCISDHYRPILFILFLLLCLELQCYGCCARCRSLYSASRPKLVRAGTFLPSSRCLTESHWCYRQQPSSIGICHRFICRLGPNSSSVLHVVNDSLPSMPHLQYFFQVAPLKLKRRKLIMTRWFQAINKGPGSEHGLQPITDLSTKVTVFR